MTVLHDFPEFVTVREEQVAENPGAREAALTADREQAAFTRRWIVPCVIAIKGLVIVAGSIGVGLRMDEGATSFDLWTNAAFFAIMGLSIPFWVMMYADRSSEEPESKSI